MSAIPISPVGEIFKQPFVNQKKSRIIAICFRTGFFAPGYFPKPCFPLVSNNITIVLYELPVTSGTISIPNYF